MSKNNITQFKTFVNRSERKKVALLISDKLKNIGEYQRATRMKNCSDFITVVWCPSCGHNHVQSVNLCRDRACPICGAKLSRKRYNEMIQCMDYIIAAYGDNIKAYFLTLTLKNVSINQLSSTLSNMLKAYKAMQRTKCLNRAIGWARNLEITYNRQYNTYHPHLHVILLFDKSYNPDEHSIMKAWQHQLGIEYEPIINLIECYNKHEQADNYDGIIIAGACAEASKYLHKSAQMLSIPDRDFKTYLSSIKGVRFTGYGGVIKTTRSKLGMKNEEIEEMEETTAQICHCGTTLQHAVFQWSGIEYQQISDIINEDEQNERTAI